jgi:hypothetical protein
MSINFGQAAHEAAARLRVNPDFKLILEGIHEHARKRANEAIDVAHEFQASACGYARALRDVYVALEAAAQQIKPQQVAKVLAPVEAPQKKA